MKKSFRKVLSIILVAVLVIGSVPMAAFAKYTVPKELMQVMKDLPREYKFAVGWGLYDISGDHPKMVASRHEHILYSSNCTIKAALLLLVCEMMDKGEISLSDKLYVQQSKIRRKDFPGPDGYYTVEYLLERMITVSNSAAYEVILHRVGLTRFNIFLKTLGSSTNLSSYSYKGDCTVYSRAQEWFAIYTYCHSGAQHSDFAWNLFVGAKFSSIRDGIQRPVAHKSGWYKSKVVPGTAADCGIVSTPNGGCYLFIVLTRSNVSGAYSTELMERMAVAADHIWDNYYAYLPEKTYARF